PPRPAPSRRRSSLPPSEPLGPSKQSLRLLADGPPQRRFRVVVACVELLLEQSRRLSSCECSFRARQVRVLRVSRSAHPRLRILSRSSGRSRCLVCCLRVP